MVDFQGYYNTAHVAGKILWRRYLGKMDQRVHVSVFLATVSSWFSGGSTSYAAFLDFRTWTCDMIIDDYNSVFSQSFLGK